MKFGDGRFIVVVIAVLLAGCAVGPDYGRPPLTPPEKFRGQVTPVEAASMADLPWWEVFGDTTLQALIKEAIAGNYDLQVATARVAQARAQAGVAQAAFFPWIGYNVKVQRAKEYAAFLGISNTNNQFVPSATNLFLGALSASWEIDVWGAVRRSNEAATAQLLATEEGRRGVLLSLVADVAQAYFELIELDALLQIAKETTATYEGIYRIFKDRLEFGVESQLEVARAEGALFSAAANIPELQSQIAAKENQISTLLGKNPSAIPRGTTLFSQEVPSTVPAGLPSALLERRPDVMKLEEQLVAANANIGVAKAQFFPQLNLTGILGKASPELTLLTNGTSTIWAIAAALTGPIFQGGRILENYRGTVALWDEAKLQYEQGVIKAFQDVASNLVALDQLAGAETELTRAVAALKKAVELAELRYLYGLSSYYEVLDAEEKLFPAQNAQAQVRLNRLVAYVQLYKALGGGWNVQNPQSAARQ
ncbi:MAG TPA: efflux transporter outer membrane subunit [Candidatus Methylomirabilis sp.]|nr:efflux transporter outer membrane subunit [Candidatus Methylomirabilis sp.]